MKKLLSYEYRNNKKDFNKLLLILIVASTVLQIGIVFGLIGIFFEKSMVFENNVYVENSINPNDANTFLAPIIFLVSILFAILIFVVSIIYFIKLANILKKDIYEGQSYIVFSLPLSGKKIIGSKYIIGIYYSLLMPLLLFVYNVALFCLLVIISSLMKGTSWTEIVRGIRELTSLESIRYMLYYTVDFKMILLNIFKAIVSSLFSISVIYAAVVTDWKFSKVKRNTSMWILYAIVFFFVWGLIQYFLGLDGGAFNEMVLEGNSGEIDFTGNSNSMYMYSIIGIVLDIAVSIGLYFYTSYIFSKKIEI
ncbi:hypothetical protein [Helcococcus sueciensis]|uniref:hypothetical protein n=1 Tax=Helcococcus sueciensis TaxID=241555 RepID=UPI0004083379|nr:hypothetical protein [Helcococcus sueciensis]